MKHRIFPTPKQLFEPYSEAFLNESFVVEKPYFLLVLSTVLGQEIDSTTLINSRRIPTEKEKQYLQATAVKLGARLVELVNDSRLDSDKQHETLGIVIAAMLADVFTSSTENDLSLTRRMSDYNVDPSLIFELATNRSDSDVVLAHEAVEELRATDDYFGGVSDAVFALVKALDADSSSLLIAASRTVSGVATFMSDIVELADPDGVEFTLESLIRDSELQNV